MTYDIKFTKDGETMALWAGYPTAADARAAIADADLAIPFTWAAEIVVNPSAV